MANLSVVLLEEEWPSTLYLAVGLRRAGCSVHIVTAADHTLSDARFLGSRITRENVPPVSSPGYLDAVAATLVTRPEAIVLPLSEAIMYRLWDASVAWPNPLYPQLEPWQQDLLRSKPLLSGFVQSRGIRTPRQISIPPVQEAGVDPQLLTAAVAELGLPVVVKGSIGSGGTRVRIAHTMAEVAAASARIAPYTHCFLQEYIAGPVFMLAGLFHRGQPLRMYAADKLECYPPGIGPSVRLLTCDDGALVEHSLAVVRALAWEGLASLDVMRGPDGELYFIEINGRPWGSIAVAAEARVDLFTPLVELIRGQVPAPDLSYRLQKEVCLFPQLALARLREQRTPSLLSLVREPRTLTCAPWRNPGLALHLARQIWWRSRP